MGLVSSVTLAEASKVVVSPPKTTELLVLLTCEAGSASLFDQEAALN